MKVISIRDFKNQATRLIRDEVEQGKPIILTKRRKPIALIKPFEIEGKDALVGYLIGEMGNLFKEAGISQADALRALEEAREEIYGTKNRY